MYISEIENEVVGYYGNYVIVSDETGELFYLEGDREAYERGSYVESQYLLPITSMPSEISSEITLSNLKEEIADMPPGTMFNVSWEE